MPAIEVKRRRGTTAENNAFTGAEGEITVDLQTGRLHVHDGTTVGGKATALKSETDALDAGKADVATTLDGYGITDGQKKIDITTTEQLTGRTVNGLPTYIKMFTGTITVAAATANTTVLGSELNAMPVKWGGWIQPSNTAGVIFPLPYQQSTTNYCQLGQNSASGLLLMSLSALVRTNAPYQVWVEYTKGQS